jgi:hypothetical protein
MKQEFKGERLTRDLMTKELRKALTVQKRTVRHLSAKTQEIEALKDEVLQLRHEAAAFQQDLIDRDNVVRVCLSIVSHSSRPHSTVDQSSHSALLFDPCIQT